MSPVPPDTMLLSPHFALWEMTHSQTATRLNLDNTADAAAIDALGVLARQILEPVRAHFNRPFRPQSAYRSPALNRATGGSPQSRRCFGEAADIELPRIGNLTLAHWIADNLQFDQLILEFYRPDCPYAGWVHISCRAGRRRNRRQILTAARQGKRICYRSGLPEMPIKRD